MDDRVKLYIAIAVENSITLICFTILAIVFKKWWIVLFTILFQSYFKKNN